MDKSLIIITKADKGGAIIIADVDDYVQETNQQLGNKEFYKKITIGSTEINQMKLNRTISEVKSSHLLNEKLQKAKTPQFKMLPKVHKEGNPVRPVIGLIDCHTTKISKYIDATCKRTQVICQRLHKFYMENQQCGKSFWQRHPCNHRCTFPIYKYSKQRRNRSYETTLKRKNIRVRIVLIFLHLVLTLNNFVFSRQNYLQIKGCTVGTKCVSSYANIFMCMFQERYIYPLIEKIFNFNLPFIDDIL